MIYLYSGTPGSGKSLDMARDIYHRVSDGKPVIANFEVNTDNIPHTGVAQFRYIDNEILSPQLLVNIARCYFKTHKFKEGSIRLYIDECQILFNCRDWNAKDRNGWLSFFSQHRKYGFDVVLVSQFDKMIDKQIRSLIEYEILHRRVTNFGNVGVILRLLTGGETFVAIEHFYALNMKTGQSFFRGRKKYFRIYDTWGIFDGAEAWRSGPAPEGHGAAPPNVSHVA